MRKLDNETANELASGIRDGTYIVYTDDNGVHVIHKNHASPYHYRHSLSARDFMRINEDRCDD